MEACKLRYFVEKKLPEWLYEPEGLNLKDISIFYNHYQKNSDNRIFRPLKATRNKREIWEIVINHDNVFPLSIDTAGTM